MRRVGRLEQAAGVRLVTLSLRRRIEARVGESRFTIRDEVENVGHTRCTHMFLYHCNAGFPVVDEGSQLLVPSRSTMTDFFETLLTADKPASAGIDIHEATLEAVMRGNLEEIEAVLDDHLAHVEQLAEAHLGRARIRRVPDFLVSKSRSGGPGGR